MSEDFELRELESDLPSEELARRKQWLELSDQDEATLAQLAELGTEFIEGMVEELYRHPETVRIVPDPEALEPVKAMQRAHFQRLIGGRYDEAYASERLKLGARHERIGLDVKWYLGAYIRFLDALEPRILQAFGSDSARGLHACRLVSKLVLLDLSLAIDTYVYQRERTIREQQEAIRELSTPVLQVREGLLILPIVGVIDAQRARQLTEQLLLAIRAKRGRVVVLDVTGVPTIDTQVANHLLQTVEASRLMGAKAIVSGLTAEVAQTLVALGVDLAKLSTVGDLQGGIDEADRMLGYQVLVRGRDLDGQVWTPKADV